MSVFSKCDQVKQLLSERIKSGEFGTDGLIPTEVQLCKLFGVSRTTIREATASLVHEGILKRIQGKGTFVTSPAYTNRSTHLSIAFLFSCLRNFKYNAYHFQMFRGVCQAAKEQGAMVIFEEINPEKDSLPEGYDEYVISSTIPSRWIREQKMNLNPCVLIGKELNNLDVPMVCADYAGGAEQIVNWLCTDGNCQTVFFLYKSEKGESMRYDRWRMGYEKAMQINKCTIDDEAIWNFSNLSNHISQLKTTIRSGKLAHPIAIFAPNDATAADVMKHLRKSGLRVPEDVGIVGFDDRSTAELTSPKLTTVGFDRTDLGRAAVGTLTQIRKNYFIQPVTYVPTEIVIRDSVLIPDAKIMKGMETSSGV